MIVKYGNLIVAVLAIEAVSGCGGAPVEESIGTSGEQLYGLLDPASQAHYWNGTQGNGALIPVCWTANASQGRGVDGVLLGAPFPGFSNAKAWMREAVEDSWGRVAGISFTGWDDICAVSGTGDDDDRFANPNKIMFAFHRNSDSALDGRWSADINGASPIAGTMIRMNRQSGTKASYQYPARHEMGHALGYAHEQIRPDNWSGGSPTTCTTLGAGEGPTPGGTNDTDFIDGKSVMCYDVTPSELSAGDVMGIQRRYGNRALRGMLVGFHGMCTRLDNAQNGSAFRATPCIGGFPSTLSRSDEGLEHLLAINGKCLNVQNNSAPNPIIGFTCSNVNNERFVFGNSASPGAELRAVGNLCLQIVNGHPETAVCNGAVTQRWDVQHATGSIRYDQIRYLGVPGSCLSTTTATGGLGEHLTTAPCSSTDTRQRFTYPGGGVIAMAAGTGWCLNVSGGVPVPGAEVGLWNGCNAVPPLQNEQFMMHGRISSLNNCLQLQGNGAPGDIVRAQACNASNTTTQIWDYYL